MIYINEEFQKININDSLTLAIGNFDGVHIGHQNIINKTKSYKDTKSAVMTFYPHPISVITNKNIPTLMDNHDKRDFLNNLGLDYFLVIDFTPDFSKLSVEEFINFLRKINVKRLVIGRDFKFAYRGQGTIEDLKKHFEVEVVLDYLFENIRVSTTYVKSLLDLGDVELVNKLLNRSYSIHGKVVHGDKVGTVIGYPTANIDYNNYYLPKIGVYATRVKIDDKWYIGCASLGHNPTLNYSQIRRLEVFILDFKGNLYEKEITVSFEHYLRDEEKYNSLEELLIQIEKDVNITLKLIKS